jgi:CRP-like cAMP-binding protein
LGTWEKFHANTELIRESELVDRLLLILGGTVRIDRRGQMVGVCGHDDFLGEIAFMLDTEATATAVVTNSLRCFSFYREPLARLLAKDVEIRHALESSFNRNLIGKLVKSNEDQVAG